MDVLTGLLDGPRARQAFLLRCLMDPPWSVRLEDESPLSVTAVVRGRMWLAPDQGSPTLLGPGDIAVLRGPGHATIADDLGTPPQAVILPGQVCRAPDGHELAEEMRQGVRSWGNSPVGETMLLTGAYLVESAVGRRLLRALPPVLVLPESELGLPLVALLGEEMRHDRPGQEAVLDRLLDLLVISVVRAWLDRPEADPPRWYAAHADPVVGPALRLLQHHPEHAWTVGGLAERVGASRAAFARRFTELVGEPPMAFLSDWRLTLAADLLLEPDATVGSVARRVGYATPFALSTAFKRERGVSPREHRAQAASGERSTVSAMASKTSQ
ncbi:AraC family transcriptional regulator [Nocardioides lijunqiniae]|uniref:AraC family transcriptional regulator n=1 Tax=Nocardioides lijunqiniae TaxID=2760832 RepID=UPI001877EDC1|nr:AraC family transcriptional regulator [Nocardioides lijunqiniae]